MTMSPYRSDVRRALAERAARAPRVIDLDRSEWYEVRSHAAEHDGRDLGRDHVGAACVLAALLVLAAVLAPAFEAVATRLW